MKIKIASVIVVSLIFTACLPSSTFNNPSKSPSVVPTIEVNQSGTCNKEIALEQSRSFFEEVEFENYSVTYHTLNDLSILNVWLVVPALDSNAADKASITQSAQLAMGRSLETQVFLIAYNDCIAHSFSHINAIVVDNEFHGWVSQIASIDDIPTNLNLANLNSDTLAPLFKKIKLVYWRTSPTEKLSNPNFSSSWLETRQALAGILPNKTENSCFTIIVDETGVDISAQWQEPNGGSGEYKEADMQATAQKIIAILSLMSPNPDLLEFNVVDKDGNLQIMGRVPQLDLMQIQIIKAPFDLNLEAP